MNSIWMEQLPRPAGPPLEGRVQTDVAIIGGGMTGLLTAYLLGCRGIDTLVLEQGTLGCGQSGRTTAKVTAQHGLIYQQLLAQQGLAGARLYASAQLGAIEEYERLILQLGIDCAWQRATALLYAQQTAPLEAERQAAAQAGIAMELSPLTGLPFSGMGLTCPNQAHFHPMAFMQALSRHIACHENTQVEAVEHCTLHTHKATIEARRVVFACHYPFINMPGYYFAKLQRQRSYLLALENAPKLDAMVLGVEPGGLSLRNAGKYLLLGGAGHPTGQNSQGGQFAYLEEQAAKLFPQARVAARWSAQDCMTPDHLPYIGTFAANRPHWYVATGYNKWGMSNAMVAARVLAATLAGENLAEAKLFSPQRPLLPHLGPVAKQSWRVTKAMAHWFQPASGSPEDLAPGHGGIVLWQGKRRGGFRDEQGQIHLVKLRCPHLGCALAWNPEERSWDCPCHGSRFDYRGNLLDGPSLPSIHLPSGNPAQ